MAARPPSAKPLACPPAGLRLRPRRLVAESQGEPRLLALALLALLGAAAAAGRGLYFVPPPLPADAPAAAFSEARALATVEALAGASGIGERQVSTPGEAAAARYLLGRLEEIAAHVAAHRPDLTARVVREAATGAVGRQVIFGCASIERVN
jgi:hypothetical protein